MSQNLHVCGGRPLQGGLTIGGSNAAGLVLLGAAAATDGEVTLIGLPDTRAVKAQVDVLRRFGREVKQVAGAWCVSAGETSPAPMGDKPLPWSAMFFLGPVLAQAGTCLMPLPRNSATVGPTDQCVKVLRSMGAELELDAGYLRVKLSVQPGEDICLDAPDPKATWTAVSAAMRLHGRTKVIGASRVPELVDAVNLLNLMGARIIGAGTDTITVTGGTHLSGGVHETIPDRNAAGFYLLAGTATGGEVEVHGVISDHLRVVMAKLEEMGAAVSVGPDWVTVNARRPLLPLNLRTGYYPDFPPELQPTMCSLLLRAQGASMVTESVFKDRMLHLNELERMGGAINRDGHLAIIRGYQLPSPARVRATDPSSAAALVVAGLMAQGESVVEQADELLEWLAEPEACLGQLGATVKWINNASAAVV